MMQSDIEQHEGRMPALPEGERGERAARRVVQWGMMWPWKRPGLIGFLLMSAWVLPIGAGGFDGVGERVFGVFVAGLFVVWGGVLFGVYRGQRALAGAGREAILRAFSLAAIARRRRRENVVVGLVGVSLLVLSSLVLVVLHTDPRFEQMDGIGGGFGESALVDMLVVVWLFAFVVMLLQFVVCRVGTGEAEVEAYRREVLGEDWFVG